MYLQRLLRERAPVQQTLWIERFTQFYCVLLSVVNCSYISYFDDACLTVFIRGKWLRFTLKDTRISTLFGGMRSCFQTLSGRAPNSHPTEGL